MGTNGIDLAAEARIEEEVFRLPKADHNQALEPIDRASLRRRHLDNRLPDAKSADTAEDFALAPLVDKIAYGIARGLIVAVKELEQHIAGETRKVGDAVDRRLDALQTSFQDVTKFVAEQRSTNIAVQDQLQQLAAAGASLRETDARQAAELETLRTRAHEFSVSVSQRIDDSTAALQESDVRQTSQLEALRAEATEFSNAVFQRFDATVASLEDSEARQASNLASLCIETRAFSQSVSDRIDGICKDLGVQQEDIAAVQSTLGAFSSRVDALVSRLDRQADAVRSMSTAYSQRETELVQLMDGLARLRAYPTPLPSNGL